METYSYVYTGSRLTQETINTVTTTDEGTETTTDTLNYFYGVNGPASVSWNGTDYYFPTNAQGDIVALLDESGNSVVQYSYDAWGNPLSATGSMAETLGSRNSLRYRGYVFDEETGLYYLQSRYYNPEICRFINADTFVATGQGIVGNNMFTYCLNNPTVNIDPAGTLAFPGEIHNEVVRRIAEKYGFYKEQFILYEGGGFGRADLISPDGQVWDVKREKPRQIAAGVKQVQKYVDNTWARFPETNLKVGGNEIDEGFFYHKSGLTTYKVAYKYVGNGIIAYDYRISEFDYKSLAMTLLITAVATAGVYAGLPGGLMAGFAFA